MSEKTLEQRQVEFAAKYKITYTEFKKLTSTLTMSEITTCLELLKASKHLSDFRRNMEIKIRLWFQDALPSSKPMTPNEFKMAEPRWPVNINLPT
jgi:hypothetical protein